MVDGTTSEVYSLKFENRLLTASSGNWESVNTWNCGSVPDLNTDVVIGNGTVTINSDVVVRSLKVNPGGKIIIAPGFTLTVTK
jgi:hypothetical protein